MKIAKVRDVKSPQRGTSLSAGIDFFIPNDWNNGLSKFLFPGESENIPSGIHVEVPKGYALIAMNKSGVSVKKRLQVGACVIDEDYQGEIHLHVYNTSTHDATLCPGEKIVQMLLVPVLYDQIEEHKLEELYSEGKSERGGGGFGSTGTK